MNTTIWIAIALALFSSSLLLFRSGKSSTSDSEPEHKPQPEYRDPSQRLEHKPERNWGLYMLGFLVLALIGAGIWYMLTLVPIKIKGLETVKNGLYASASQCKPSSDHYYCGESKGAKKCLALDKKAKYGYWGRCVSLTKQDRMKGLCLEYDTKECGISKGLCRKGLIKCVLPKNGYLVGTWGPCKGDIKPKLEICDGYDNDCDGQSDEGIKNCDTKGFVAMNDMVRRNLGMECLPGSTRMCGSSVGQCSYGTMTCGIDGYWGRCEMEIGPNVEICDGLDNDCNGKVDDGLSCTKTKEVKHK